MSQRLRWGILGTGNIARQFAVGVNACRRGSAGAVASRDGGKAKSFAGEFRFPRAFGSYEELLADPEVDAVYVSLPNSMHYEWTIKALRAGKHVLCEKPFSVTAAESAEMFDVAQRAGRVVMEAFMYRSHPQTHAVLAAVTGGTIGAVRLVRTSFCFRTTRIDDNVRFRTDLAGGALMDIGCYCLSFSRLIAGEEPAQLHVTGHVHPSGVDDLAAGFLRFPSGIVASFTCGMTVQADNAASICGTDGYIEVPVPWKPPVNRAQYTVAHGTPPKMDQKAGARPPPPPRETFSVDAGVDLYGLEADEFAAAVLDGTPPRVSRQDTIGNMVLLERMRRELGLRY